MTTPYYVPSGNPTTGGAGASAVIRAEFVAIAAGFALLPQFPLTAGAAVVVGAGGGNFTITGGLSLAGSLTTTGAFATTLIQGAAVSLTLPLVSGTLATLAGTETLSNKTLVAPALGTPASGVATNLTGTAAGLTAGNTLAIPNLSGPITSSGTTTAVAAQTGTGSTFVMQASPTISNPTLSTPSLGAATATSINGVAITTAAGATITVTAGTTMTFPGSSGTVVTTAAAQTLSNKTATTPTVGDNSTSVATTAFVATALGGVTLRGYLSGLQISSTTATTIVIGTGVCADDTNVQMLAVTGTTLNLATTGANGLDTGSLTTSATYHAFAIAKTDGTTAFLASTNLSSPTFPSGYTLKRRLFSFKTDGSSHVLALTQAGDLFQLAVPISETNITGATGTITLVGLPAGIAVLWQGSGFATNGGAATWGINWSTPGITISSPAFQVAAGSLAATGSQAAWNVSVLTSTTPTVTMTLAGALTSIQGVTTGWIDRRGRDL